MECVIAMYVEKKGDDVPPLLNSTDKDWSKVKVKDRQGFIPTAYVKSGLADEYTFPLLEKHTGNQYDKLLEV